GGVVARLRSGAGPREEGITFTSEAPAQERPESPAVPPEPTKLPDVGDAAQQTTLPKAKPKKPAIKGKVKSPAPDPKETKAARVKAKSPTPNAPNRRGTEGQ